MVGKQIVNPAEVIRDRILKACQRAGRNINEVCLIGASKSHSALRIREVQSWGVTHFGENYVQEALSKQRELADLNLEWHFIGGLQTNKVKHVVGAFSWIHSLDRKRLAEVIHNSAEALGLEQKVLIEVNLAGESSKAGLNPQEAFNFLQFTQSLNRLKVCGLMVMPPLGETAEDSRMYFKQTYKLFCEWKKVLPFQKQKDFCQLSMGTSAYFEVAIEEGATFIRIGTLLMGERI